MTADQALEVLNLALDSGFLEGTAVALGMPASVLLVLRILKNRKR